MRKSKTKQPPREFEPELPKEPSGERTSRLGAVLQPGNHRAGVSDREQLRGTEGAPLSASTAPALDGRNPPVFLAGDLRGTRGGTAVEKALLMSGERKRVAVRSRYRAAPRLYSSHIFAVERHLVGPAILSPGLTSQGLRP